MLKNYLTIAVRHLLRHKVYSVINIAGLAIGMACCILILLFVQDELSYDHYHTNANRIYRVVEEIHMAGKTLHAAVTPALMAPALLNDYPEVIKAVRLSPLGMMQKTLIRYAMNRWLQDFAYRINIGLGTFIVGGVLALVIALVTVSAQAIKAALANPVAALRYE